MNKKTDWHIEVFRGITEDQATELSQLTSAFEPPGRQRRTHSPEYYTWKLSDSPSGKGILTAAVNSKGTIVASTTVARKTVFVDGAVQNACEFGDSFTDQAYQKQGIMTKLVKLATQSALEDGLDLIFTTPNHNSLPGYERKCNFTRKSGYDLYNWVVPLRPAAVLARKYPALSAFSGLDIIPRSFGKYLSGRERHNVRVIQEPEFHSIYDDLNAQLVQRYHFMVSRTAPYLTYRYGENPEKHKYRTIEYKSNTGELEAALIYKECIQDDLKVLYIADIFSISRAAFKKVWNTAIQIGLKEQFHLVALWQDRSFLAAAQMLPLSAIPIERKNLMMYRSPSGLNLVSSDKPILFSIGDTDNI